MFPRNSRFPEMVKGDLKAIMASCQLGKRRLEQIADRFGVEKPWTLRLKKCWNRQLFPCALH
jgi:N-methylhydantoinase B/oxoprolinase/acetone carboxylase alpha subunit